MLAKMKYLLNSVDNDGFAPSPKGLLQGHPYCPKNLGQTIYNAVT